ncbi:MAG TPA: hypothetical protein VGH31_11235 [Acidimicrobiales bacterium]
MRQAKPWVPGLLRMVFGLMWAVDATLKWAPAFAGHLSSYFSSEGQPGWVAAYISWWSSLVGHDPRWWAYGLATAESVVAVSLLTGIGFRWVCGGGAVLSLLIWSTAEGFGGPYGPGSTDVGTSVAYVVVFGLLWWSDAGSRLSLAPYVGGWRTLLSNRRAAVGTVGLAAVTALLVSLTAVASFGPTSASNSMSSVMSGSMSGDGGQMQMSPGGQDQH